MTIERGVQLHTYIHTVHRDYCLAPPRWNATEGRRHVLVHTGDAGRGEMLPDARAVTANAFLLTHWWVGVVERRCWG